MLSDEALDFHSPNSIAFLQDCIKIHVEKLAITKKNNSYLRQSKHMNHKNL